MLLYIANDFRNVHEKLREFSEEYIGEFLKKCGFEIIKVVSGAWGALFGTLLTGQASYYIKSLNGKETLTLSVVAEYLTF